MQSVYFIIFAADYQRSENDYSLFDKHAAVNHILKIALNKDFVIFGAIQEMFAIAYIGN